MRRRYIQIRSSQFSLMIIHPSIYRIHHLAIQTRAVLGSGGGDVGIRGGIGPDQVEARSSCQDDKSLYYSH
jgi:hypothetical protein